MNASFQTPNLVQPIAGSVGIESILDFTGGTNLAVDLTGEMLDGKIDFIQSVYIDNRDNSAECALLFGGLPSGVQRITAPAFRQGWYPVSWPIGNARLSAQSQGGVKVTVIFANYAMPYSTWGPVDGTATVPPLTNVAVNALNFAGAGNNQLVAGVAGKSIKLYRGMFSVDQPTILTFTDGPGGTVLFAAQLTAGGSITFQASGVNWFNTSANTDLTLHSSAACNVYGGFGYVAS